MYFIKNVIIYVSNGKYIFNDMSRCGVNLSDIFRKLHLEIILFQGKFYFYTLFDTTILLYHQSRDIFMNTTLINEQKTIVPLPYLLLNHRFFLSLFEIHLLSELPSRSAVSLSHAEGDESGLPRIAIQSLQIIDSCSRFTTPMSLILVSFVCFE